MMKHVLISDEVMDFINDITRTQSRGPNATHGELIWDECLRDIRLKVQQRKEMTESGQISKRT